VTWLYLDPVITRRVSEVLVVMTHDLDPGVLSPANSIAFYNFAGTFHGQELIEVVWLTVHRNSGLSERSVAPIGDVS